MRAISAKSSAIAPYLYEGVLGIMVVVSPAQDIYLSMYSRPASAKYCAFFDETDAARVSTIILTVSSTALGRSDQTLLIRTRKPFTQSRWQEHSRQHRCGPMGAPYASPSNP